MGDWRKSPSVAGERMKTLYAVTRTRGPAWDQSKPLRSQDQWPEHARFMDRLDADGFVVLGGPVGDSGDVLLAVDAPGEDEINATLGRDPWSRPGILIMRAIQRWTILLSSGEKV